MEEGAKDVLSEIVEAENHSEVIGLKLKLPQNVVETIHSQHTQPRHRLFHVLTKFFEQVEPTREPTPASWRLVTDVLSSPPVNLPELAKRLEDKIALFFAVRNGDKTEAERLIAKGVDPNIHPPMIDFTPLMEASKNGNREIAQLLLEKGSDPNQTNSENWTALMAAANNGRYNTVDILLQYGANPDMQDRTGWSALMAAVYKAHEDIALRLIEAGATPHIQDGNRTSALLLAIANKEQEKIVDAFLDRKPQLDLQDRKGETALTFACMMKNLRFVRRLLSMGANPDIFNEDGNTALLIATQSGEIEIVEELLKNGANPNLGPEFETPLEVANEIGFEEIADLLKIYGAELSQTD